MPFEEKIISIQDVAYENIREKTVGSRTKDKNKLTWNIFAHGWSNSLHKKVIWTGDIFENNKFLKRVKKYVLPEKRFKSFAKELNSAVWGEFYKRFQYECSITSWPTSISSKELEKAFGKIVDGESDIDVELSCEEKVSVGELIFFNWTPFAEYVWNNRKILEEMVKDL